MADGVHHPPTQGPERQPRASGLQPPREEPSIGAAADVGQEAEAIERLFLILDGLIAIRLAEIAALSDDDRQRLAQQAGDELAAGADRLTAPGNFDDRRERARALAALANGIAIGAHQPGGITWAGRHWCNAPHLDCLVNSVNKGAA